MRAVVVVFFVLCLAVPSIADIQCGGPENKKCDSNHFCCGDKSMKRPSPDEQGTAPHGLTKSHCLDFATPPSEERAALRKHKKMICPDKEFRQFNGEQPDAIATRVPLKRPKNRQRSITPLVAGISWGFHEDPFYCTLGAVLCAKSGDKSKRYFVANQHCVDENSFEDIGVVKEKLDKHIALQPSINAQDEVDNAKAKKPAPVGRFVFGERNWVEALGTFRDTAIIELDPQVPVKARVMVEDNPNRMKQQTKRVLGFKTFAEIEALKKDHQDLKFCISGRTGGWGCFPVRAVEDKAHEGRAIVMENAHGSENINPQFLYGGNSGSVFWYKDPKEDGYWAVGLFSGHPEIDPMEDVLASVKAKSGLDLTVCTHDAMPRNAAYKKGNKVKHF